jgi:hypothetical protein
MMLELRSSFLIFVPMAFALAFMLWALLNFSKTGKQ